MKYDEFKPKKKKTHVESPYFDRLWEESWTYIKTVVDVVRDPIIILDKDLQVLAANESFYETFHVESEDTIHKNVYELGNKQWNISALRRFLDDVLTKNSFFKGFQVTHDFPNIGRKTMILNARRIYRENAGSVQFPLTILLVIEDVTEMMNVAEALAHHTNTFEEHMSARTSKLESQIKALETMIQQNKKQIHDFTNEQK